MMLKITAILSLFLIATLSHELKWMKKEAEPSSDYIPGSAVWAQGLSCDSCGSECASACGTRHFRSCCFNYLRKKRPDTMNMRYYSGGTRPHEFPVYSENIPDDRFSWYNDRFPGNMDEFYDRD